MKKSSPTRKRSRSIMNYPSHPGHDHQNPLHELNELVADLEQIRRDLRELAETTLAKALRVGELLVDFKAKEGKYGEWLAWLKCNVPNLSAETARRYMRVYRRRELIKSVTVTDLTSAYRLLTQAKRSGRAQRTNKREANSGPIPGKLEPQTIPVTNPRAETPNCQHEAAVSQVNGTTELALVRESVALDCAPIARLPYVWGVSVNSLLLASLQLLEHAGQRDSSVYKKIDEATKLVADLTMVKE